MPHRSNGLPADSGVAEDVEMSKRTGNRGARQRHMDIDVSHHENEDELCAAGSPAEREKPLASSNPVLHCLLAPVRVMRCVVAVVLPSGGVLSTAFNLASGSIGAGILGLPAAADSCGLVMAMIYLIIITFFSVYSMRILMIVMEKTQIKTLEGIARHLFPRWNHAFSYWVAFIRWFYSFGACVGYVISVGNSYEPIFKTASRQHPDNSALKYLATKNGLKLMTSLQWLVIMLPLVIPRHIDSLRYASMLAVTFMCYFVLAIIVHSGMNGLPKHRDSVVISGPGDDPTPGAVVFLFRTGNSAMNGLGTFCFAYVVQINVCEGANDMLPEIRDVKHFTIASFIAMMLCCILYMLVCIFGYFDFGAEALAGNSILLMYNPLEEPEMMVAYVGVLIKLCVSYALLSMAARNSIYYVIGWQEKYRRRALVVAKTGRKSKHTADAPPCTPQNQREGDDGDDTDIIGESAGQKKLSVTLADAVELYNDDREDAMAFELQETDGRTGEPQSAHTPSPQREQQQQQPPQQQQQEGEEEVSGGHGFADNDGDTTFVDNIPLWRHLVVVLCLAVICLLCGLFIPSINIVFGFAGAISGGFLGFLFPSLFFMYAGGFSLSKVGAFDYFTTYVLLICGVIAVVFGTGATIYSMV